MTLTSKAVVLAVDAVERSDLWRGRMVRESWGDGVTTVSALSALSDGVQSFEDCTAAGWPDWMAPVVAEFYDMSVGASDEQAAADEWFRELAAIVARPVDYAAAEHHFLAALLKSVAERPTLVNIVAPTIALHERVLAGDNVMFTEWDAVMATAGAVAEAAEDRSAEQYAGQAVGYAWPSGEVGEHTRSTLDAAEHCGFAREEAGAPEEINGRAAQREMLLVALRAAVQSLPASDGTLGRTGQAGDIRPVA